MPVFDDAFEPPTTRGHDRPSFIRELLAPLVPRRRRAPKGLPPPAPPRPRRPQARSVSRRAWILAALLVAPIGLTVAELGVALGMSRQLTLYHVKALAAEGRLTAMLEPCRRNGQSQFRVWNDARLAEVVRVGGAGAWRVAA